MSQAQFETEVMSELYEGERTMEASNEIAAYKPTLAVLATLEQKYKAVVFDVTTTDGMKDAKSSYKDINTHSITLEAARVAEKAASLAHGKFVDSEAKRIAERLDALRLPIKAQIEVETKRIEREKEDADRLAAEEFNRKEAERKAAEEATLASQRAEIARQQAEMEAAARASRLKIEEEERAARMVREEADRTARLAREAEEAEARKVRQIEEDRLASERAKLEAERRIVEEQQRKEREAEEAKQREILRKQANLLDGQEMLATFEARFGNTPEFAFVIKAIRAYLKKDA